jgi:hypothetical protein
MLEYKKISKYSNRTIGKKGKKKEHKKNKQCIIISTIPNKFALNLKHQILLHVS